MFGKGSEFDLGEGLGEDVGDLVPSVTVVEDYFIACGFLPDKMVLNVNMFHVLVVDWILCEQDTALVVFFNDCCCGLCVSQFLQELVKPDSLFDCLGGSYILGLGG